jgi:NAD(P)-dependent dehydrogenase (short-subunit alcohol dehydrogenase family)
MQNKETIVVFGGSGDIGKAILARLLEDKKLDIIATSRGNRSSRSTRIKWVRLRAESLKSCQQFSLLLQKLRPRIKACIYCIGTSSTKRLIVDTPPKEWMSLYIVNCVGFVNAYRAARNPIRQNHARVVILSSDTTRKLSAHNGPYTASKLALEGVAITLAKEEAVFGVRINVIAPSLVESKSEKHILRLKGVKDRASYIQNLPWSRLLSPSEIASIAVSVAINPEWDYVSGQIFRITATL